MINDNNNSKYNYQTNYLFIVKQSESKQRLDSYLVSMFMNTKLTTQKLSRSQIQNLIKNNLITVNKKYTKANYLVKKDDAVHANIELVDQNIDCSPEDIPLDIVYEDDDILIINKPQGMVIHPGAGNFSGTLVNALLYYAQQKNFCLSKLNGNTRPGIVHRIDKDTSGIVVVAKNIFAHAMLSEQFSKHTINRKYIAIVCGSLKNKYGVINKPIARSILNRKKMCIKQDGRCAITHYKVLDSFKEYTLVKLKLDTGRTHQIRVHMSSIGHSVLGDKVYGSTNNKIKVAGQVLHAQTLGFIHPTTKKYIQFTQKPPFYFTEIIKKLKCIG